MTVTSHFMLNFGTIIDLNLTTSCVWSTVCEATIANVVSIQNFEDTSS
jgi:hypothetical protein